MKSKKRYGRCVIILMSVLIVGLMTGCQSDDNNADEVIEPSQETTAPISSEDKKINDENGGDQTQSELSESVESEGQAPPEMPKGVESEGQAPPEMPEGSENGDFPGSKPPQNGEALDSVETNEQ